ncbi:MAG: hypothetical protein Q8Q23_04245 [bacterium]|nr:hypothetical protein [bacterium]
MLTQLFSSAVRVKILKYLTLHPGEDFSAADIAKKTGSIVRSVNKELTKLLSTDSVIEETKPVDVNKKMVNVKHYRINTNFVLYNELQNVFVKIQVQDLEAFKEKLRKLGDIKYAILTGRFTNSPDTSIDLLLVGSVKNKYCKKAIGDFEKMIGWEINWTLLDESDYHYRRDVGDVFIAEVMMAKKIEVINSLH